MYTGCGARYSRAGCLGLPQRAQGLRATVAGTVKHRSSCDSTRCTSAGSIDLSLVCLLISFGINNTTLNVIVTEVGLVVPQILGRLPHVRVMYGGCFESRVVRCGTRRSGSDTCRARQTRCCFPVSGTVFAVQPRRVLRQDLGVPVLELRGVAPVVDFDRLISL